MRRVRDIVALLACAAVVGIVVPGQLAGQPRRGAPPPRRPPVHRPVERRAVVFIGGYFYDPFFGPYPWWPRYAYPYEYYPVYDNRAVVRVIAEPKDAEVYVDGFYAGTVHDFNDWFQGLPLPPGGHEIALYLERYRTTRDRLYLSPGQTVKLRRTLEPLPAGEASERPMVSPPVPPPPNGSFMPPRTPRPPRLDEPRLPE
jgi:hypothetical protein